MAFRTKLDFSSNRQVKQRIETFTHLSGGTAFGVPFSSLLVGPNLATSGITFSSTTVLSTFSGNSTNDVYVWYYPQMNSALWTLSAITPTTSAITQNALSFSATSYATLDGNTFATAYSGISFDITPISITDLGGGNYVGSVQTNLVQFLSAATLDFTGRTIWNDVSGITRTQDLIITRTPVVGANWTCIDSEGKGSWVPASASTSGLWVAGTGLDSARLNGSSSLALGNYSVAEGYKSLASGNGSHAEGGINGGTSGGTASGNGSHAEGQQTLASGDNSHAEGEVTTASGTGSHAEGGSTKAIGDYSHAEGDNSIASGINSHAEGILTLALGDNSHAEGHQTSATTIHTHAEGDNTIASGIASHAEGYKSLASGVASHAEGLSSLAFGDYSHAEGGGYDYIHTTYYSGGTASGSGAHAEGWETVSSDWATHAEGFQTSATTRFSHAEGYLTLASGFPSHAEGGETIASGQYSHTEGFRTLATGAYSHAEGFGTKASGQSSHAENTQNTASASNSHAGGNQSTASGTTSFVHGLNSVAGGTNTIVLGASITGLTANTTYVDNLNIKTLGAGPGTSIGVNGGGQIVLTTSDIRIKENISTLTNSLDKIKNLRGVTFQLIDREANGDDFRIGFIAQEVNQVVPELTFINKTIPEEYMGVHYSDVTALLVEAVKELASGGTSNNYLQTQTILAEDNNIELNYSGTPTTALGGGITVLHGMGIDLSSELIIDANGDWTTNNDFIPNKITLPSYTPSGSTDTNGNLGNVTRDDDYLYIKISDNKWKRIKLEEF